jgi:molecular chaperone HscB
LPFFTDGPQHTMPIQDTHFALFGLPERYALDDVALDRAYREVQSRVHPDRFARASAAEQRVALQWATRANEAYRTLREPLRRAIYLCGLHGQDPVDEHDTKMAPDFLMQQLEWREALDAARASGDQPAIDRLRATLDEARDAMKADVARALDADDAATASARVRQWMFVERFAEDVDAARRSVPAPTH